MGEDSQKLSRKEYIMSAIDTLPTHDQQRNQR